MTALEAYILAKKIAASAVSGIKSLSVVGTTLYIELNDGTIIPMVFPVPKDGRGITGAVIDSKGHLILTYDDGTTVDAGPVPGSDVKVTQFLNHGVKIANIKVNGVSTDLFAPAGGGGSSDYYIADTLAELPTDLTADDRKIYYCIENNAFNLWDGTEWSIINRKVVEITEADYNALTPAEQNNGTIYFIVDKPGGGGGGITSYNDLTDLPQINGVTLQGNKTSDDIHLSSLDSSQLNSLLDMI